MVDVAKVKLFGMDMGTFRWDESYNVARFEYDKNFADKGIEPSPIMMPVQQGRIYSFGNLNRDTFNGLPGMLADSLPDTYGRALFDRWLTLTGRTSGNPVETLCFLVPEHPWHRRDHSLWITLRTTPEQKDFHSIDSRLS